MFGKLTIGISFIMIQFGKGYWFQEINEVVHQFCLRKPT